MAISRSMTRFASTGRKHSGGNFLAGMGVGVLVGLLISLGIAFYLNRTPIPFMTAKPKQADKNGGANEGHSCVKGRFATGFVHAPDRITRPMVATLMKVPVTSGRSMARPARMPRACPAPSSTV